MECVEVLLVVARRENGLEENGDKSLVRDECRVCDPFHSSRGMSSPPRLSKLFFAEPSMRFILLRTDIPRSVDVPAPQICQASVQGRHPCGRK